MLLKYNGTTYGHGLVKDDHGGHCCGMSHLHTFPLTATKEARKEWLGVAIFDVLEELGCDCGECDQPDPENFRHCIEVVLTTEQLDHWEEILIEAGFEKVFAFHNDNSGNTCHVFLLATNGGRR